MDALNPEVCERQSKALRLFSTVVIVTCSIVSISSFVLVYGGGEVRFCHLLFFFFLSFFFTTLLSKHTNFCARPASFSGVSKN